MLQAACSAGVGDAGEGLEAGVHLQRVRRHGHRVLARARSSSASASATAVLPTPVGPNSAMICIVG